MLINTPEAYHTLFGPKGNVKKSLYYDFWPRSAETVATWNCVDIDKHARKRRVLSYAFSPEALKSAEPFVVAHVDRWCELLAEEASNGGADGWSRSLNMADWSNYLVFDVLSDLSFGKSFNMKEHGSDLRFVPKLMGDWLLTMHPISHSPIAPLWVWLKPRGLDRLLELAAPPAFKRWERFVEQCLDERTRAEAELERSGNHDAAGGRRDIFYHLFHAADPDTGHRELSRGELYGEAESMIVAGSDTTSIVTSALLFYLARDPAAQARVAGEVRAAFATAAQIRPGARLAACRYLRACVREALRMTPPLSAEPPRVVMAGGATVPVGGDLVRLPAGTHASVGFYCLSYSEAVFGPDAGRFRPGRWIVGAGEDGEGGATEESVARAEAGFCAFSYGARACVGKQLAWMEMSVTLAKLVFLLEFRRDPTNDLGAGDPHGTIGRRVVGQYQTYEAFVSMRDGPMVQFRKREQS